MEVLQVAMETGQGQALAVAQAAQTSSGISRWDINTGGFVIASTAPRRYCR
jgi:hypothetical protein